MAGANFVLRKQKNSVDTFGMVRKRSRSNTEQRFQDAVLELVAESGCAELGVNLVAQRAGADKVLIYRYFGDLDGLLQCVAESRNWFPDCDELCDGLPTDPAHLLSLLARRISQHIRTDAATHKLALWRHAVQNPLTKQYTSEWKTLWQKLPKLLSQGLDYNAREDWAKACALLALSVQADLAGEAIDLKSLDAFSAQLEAPQLLEDSDSFEDSDVLPTNLL
jgi:AcrR family transcriptional regulator